MGAADLATKGSARHASCVEGSGTPEQLQVREECARRQVLRFLERFEGNLQHVVDFILGAMTRCGTLSITNEVGSCNCLEARKANNANSILPALFYSELLAMIVERLQAWMSRPRDSS